MSSNSFQQITQDINQALVAFRQEAGGTMAGFGALANAALAPGVLSALQKELIALAIGVASRCDGGLGFPVKALVRLGVTRAQLTETLAVAVYMGGGPALMAAAEAWRAYEEFSGGAAP